MAKKKPTGKGAPSGASETSGDAPSSRTDTRPPYAIDPIPAGVDALLRTAELSSSDRNAIADAFEIYNSSNPRNFLSAADEVETIEAAIQASKRLRTAVGRLSEFTIGEMSGSSFGPKGCSFEAWLAGLDKDLRELESELSAPAAKAKGLVGKLPKKPTFEARGRLFRAVFRALPPPLGEARMIELAADILEAAGVPIPADTGSRRKLLQLLLPRK